MLPESSEEGYSNWYKGAFGGLGRTGILDYDDAIRLLPDSCICLMFKKFASLSFLSTPLAAEVCLVLIFSPKKH